ncbi:hypothetical protein, partial [Brucella anthropi]|uniref:hypothetical protein n=1 Tax=Brucella anthropi TaxID=529 RepID=UPI00312CB47C
MAITRLLAPIRKLVRAQIIALRDFNNPSARMKTFSNNPRFQFRRPVSVASARIDNIQPPDKSIATIYHQILLLLLKTLLAETSLTQNALNQWDRDGAY